MVPRPSTQNHYRFYTNPALPVALSPTLHTEKTNTNQHVKLNATSIVTNFTHSLFPHHSPRLLPAARSIKLDLQPFTLVGATTRAGMLTNPLRDRFGIVARLEFYTPEELARIVKRSAGLLKAPMDAEGGFEIARRSRGTPRIANRLLRRVRDFADVKGSGHISLDIANRALAMLDVDPMGFDIMDRKLLEAVIHRFDGGPVGLDNIAASIGEERETIEDVIEPYLIQQGYLQRTPRGRIATLAAYRHLGVTPRTPEGGLFTSD